MQDAVQLPDKPDKTGYSMVTYLAYPIYPDIWKVAYPEYPDILMLPSRCT